MLNIQAKLAHNMNDSSDMEIEQIDEINNFKGIYYNEDTEQKFYEHDAHFSFKDMCNRLEKLLKTLSPSRRGKTAINGFQKLDSKEIHYKKSTELSNQTKSKDDQLDSVQASKLSNVMNKKSLITDSLSNKTRNRGRIVSNHNTLNKQQNNSFKFNSIQKFGNSKEKTEQANKLVDQLNAASTATKEAYAQPSDSEVNLIRNIKVNKLGAITKKTSKNGKEIIENNLASEKYRTNADDTIDQLKQSLNKPQNKSLSIHKSRNNNSAGPRPNKTELGGKSISVPKYGPLKTIGKPSYGMNQTTTKFTSLSQPKKNLGSLSNNTRTVKNDNIKSTVVSQEKKKLPLTMNNFKKIQILKKPDQKKVGNIGKNIY